MSAEIVILSGARTPIGSFQGALASVPAPHLGAIAIREAVARAGAAPSDVTDVRMGNVLQAGIGQAPARQASIQAGLPPDTRTVTVHKVCGSGLQAVIDGAHALAAGAASIVVAGGMENMSAAPYLLPNARSGYRLGHQQVVDSVIRDGLWDPYNDLHMGACAERCVERYGFTRAEQEAYAIASFQRAIAAQREGRFAGEIAPVDVTEGKKPTRVEHDEGPARVDYDRIPTLRPAFESTGTPPPATASTINDGAAALVLTTADEAKRRGLRPIARLVSQASHAQKPEWFTTAPVAAIAKALERAGKSAREIDLFEINEAFAVVALACMKDLAIDHGKVNVRGGAVALGHPIGASGARILVTLLAALEERGGRFGCAGICIGGGEATAVVVERIAG
jgi:acetyl-CoA C-acetyltransferase